MLVDCEAMLYSVGVWERFVPDLGSDACDAKSDRKVELLFFSGFELALVPWCLNGDTVSATQTPQKIQPHNLIKHGFDPEKCGGRRAQI